MTNADVRPAPPSGLGRRAVRGAVLVVGGQAARIVIQVVSVVVLARLLAPHDYGLVAMVMAVVGVADIFRDFGLSAAAVQAPELSRAQRDNLFWINVVLGLGLAGLAVLAAPLVAGAYGRDELVDLTRVLALLFVLNGVATQYRADLNRRLHFGALAFADVAASLAGLLAGVIAALNGAGYWSLAAQQLTQVTTMMVLVVVRAGWRPGAPDRSAPMAGLVRFGWHLVGSQVVGYVGNNADTFVIGTRFGAAPLGLYNRGFQLLMTPLGQLRGPTTSVALPVLSRIQDDVPRYQSFLLRGQLALGYGLVVGLGLVAGAAAPITAVFLGEQWVEVVPILRALAIAGGLQTLAFVGYWVYLSRGLTAQLRRYTVLTAGLRIGCILVGSHWGVRGVAVAYATAAALEWPLSIWWLSRMSPLPAGGLVRGAVRIIVVAAAAAVASWGAATAAATWAPAVGLLLAALAGLAAVAVLARVVPALGDDVRQVLAAVRQARRART